MTAWEDNQRQHEDQQDLDPEHDNCGCWCCCFDCEDLHDEVAS